MRPVEVARRALLYVGLAVASLVILSGLLASSIYTGISVPEVWVAFIFWTVFLCLVVVKQAAAYRTKAKFWLAMATLLLTHLVIFVPILRLYPEWRPIWFVPVVVVEAGLWDILLSATVLRRS